MPSGALNFALTPMPSALPVVDPASVDVIGAAIVGARPNSTKLRRRDVDGWRLPCHNEDDTSTLLHVSMFGQPIRAGSVAQTCDGSSACGRCGRLVVLSRRPRPGWAAGGGARGVAPGNSQ